MLRLLLIHRLQPPSMDMLLRIGYHFQQFLLPSVPFDLRTLPFIDLLAVSLELLLATADLIVQLFLPRLLLLELALQCLILGLQFFAFLNDTIDTFTDTLHLFLQTLSLFLLRHRCLKLSLQRLKLLLLPAPCRLYQKQQKLRSVSRVLLLQLQQPLIIVNSHLYFFLQRSSLILQLLRVYAMLIMMLKYLTIVVLVTHCYNKSTHVVYYRILPTIFLWIHRSGLCLDLCQLRSCVRECQGWSGDLLDGCAQALTHHEVSCTRCHGWYPRHLRDDRRCHHRPENHCH